MTNDDELQAQELLEEKEKELLEDQLNSEKNKRYIESLCDCV